MFERFTDRARKVCVLAQDEAQMLNHSYIGTEHLLLAMLHEGEGVAGQVLTSLGLTLDRTREIVADIVGKGKQHSLDHIPFTPRAKKILALSLREALQLGHNYIGTEHILLGLLREAEGVGAHVLVEEGYSLDEVRNATLERINPSTKTPPKSEPEQEPEYVLRITYQDHGGPILYSVPLSDIEETSNLHGLYTVLFKDGSSVSFSTSRIIYVIKRLMREGEEKNDIIDLDTDEESKAGDKGEVEHGTVREVRKEQ